MCQSAVFPLRLGLGIGLGLGLGLGLTVCCCFFVRINNLSHDSLSFNLCI